MSDDMSSSGTGRKSSRLGWTQIGLVVAAVVIFAAVLGSILISSGGNHQQVASATPADKKPVKVIIAGTNDAKEEVTDGGIVGEGTFRASGAVTDRGTARAYRAVSVANPGLILLRYVTKGKAGAITYIVRIDTTRRPVTSRWTIESGTRSYKGLHGQGIETENATFTVSTLRGRMWH
jgi:hypothetical protein